MEKNMIKTCCVKFSETSMKGMCYMVHDLTRKKDKALGILYPSQVPSVVTVKVSRSPLPRLCYRTAHFY